MAGVVSLAYACLIAYALWEFREWHVTLPAQTKQPLTEEQAVALSREALHRVGEDITKLAPRAYANGTNLYARNAYNPYNGCVLWATGSDPSFVVHLDQTGGEIRCGVSRCK